ncbi:von Willebrand factor [Pirellulimonas nuda]|uniref:von Willebrand factor n=1 Tax=Pirellulimonas nuda TaxID=2528009 RepID=A0A518D9H9_9BACT|nr:von Willebrand factor type A domain-containing protein [Pirellulimonas nuda]QDU88139.1 von Willebrand factor [Pirellulimonas nuda]
MNDDLTPDRDDLADRLVDLALAEAIGGQSPPDLSDRIAARWAEEAASLSLSAEHDAMEMQPKTRWPRYAAWGVAATLLLAVGVSLKLSDGEAPRDVALKFTPVETSEIESPEDKQRIWMQRSVPIDQEEKARVIEAHVAAARANANGDESTSASAGDVSVVYPDPEVWEDLTRRRKKFASVDLEKQAAVRAARQNSSTVRGFDIKANGGQSLPSPYYLQDDVQYHAGVEFEGLDLGTRMMVTPRIIIAGPTGIHDRRIEDLSEIEGQGPDAGGDKYDRIYENPFMEAVGERAVSTFSIDVDTASYANVRQMLLEGGRLPPPDAVRLEEFVNYFGYDYSGPEVDSEAAPSPGPSPQGGRGDVPFASHIEVAGCPWAPTHRLVRIGLKGRELAADKRPLSNLVFLIDVSGSMQDSNKLPLVVEGFKALVRELGENDRVAIVVYASSEGLALDSTPGDQQDKILAALGQLAAGGSTAGGAGIELAYKIAEDHKIAGGCNRVILCTDGDFNVGTTSTAALQRMVEEKAKETGVFLSVCGFGRGNLNDAMMETVSNKGNGSYYYVDGMREARRVFVDGLTGTLVTIAKDVKIQVEFNPAQVAGYRLLGYENRMLRTEDFNDDTKDAGEIGAGHTVTALYEIVPTGASVPAGEVDELKYQPKKPEAPADAGGKPSDELLTLKMRYKQPESDTSSKLEWAVKDGGNSFAEASKYTQFAAAVASFGMLLRGSEYAGDATLDAVLEIAASATGDDPKGERAEFLDIVRAAKRIKAE